MKGEVRAIEVVMGWGGSPIAAELLRGPRRLEVGDEQGATFLLPSETLQGRFTLIEPRGQEHVLNVPAGWAAHMTRRGEGGEPEPVDLAGVPSDAHGTRAVVLGPGARARLDMGELSFWVRTTDPPERVGRALGFDWSTWRWMGLSFAFHAVLVGIAMLSPPNASALMRDLGTEEAEYLRYELADVEKATPAPDDSFLQSEEQGAQGNEGKPMPGDEGSAGAPDEKRDTGGGVAVKGPQKERRVPKNAEDMKKLGVLGALAKATDALGAISSPYGADKALGFSDRDAYGPLMSDALGFGPGNGGFGMIGTGRGGGCAPGQDCLAGTVGVGELATVGSGRGCSEAEVEKLTRMIGREKALERCSGTLPSGVGGEMRGHQARGPVLRTEGVDTTGGLAAEQVRRVIHRNRPKLRFCYEQQLTSRPDLGGRVAVKFVIKPSGAVQSAQVATSSIGDREVEQCVTGVVGRLSFPRSPGLTVVTYPFVFATQ